MSETGGVDRAGRAPAGPPAVTADERWPPGVARVLAPNPSPLTLEGTNTYLVEGWVVDPGPNDDEHLARVVARAGSRARGIVLTHSHPDHADAAEPLAAALGGVPVVAPREGEQVGPFVAVATPGHAQDHVCLFWQDVCFCGDLVAGRGSVLVPPERGALAAYLRSLERVRSLQPRVLCPGHGPPIWNPARKLDEYIAHRLRREAMLLAALAEGLREKPALLDRAWFDVPPELRPVAELNLRAHLWKLADEGRLPADVDPSSY